MRGLVGAFRRGWKGLWRPAPPAAPFKVACPCGAEQTGVRGARYQVVRCPGCGEDVFVLPRSPLPAVPDDPPGGRPAAGRRSPWLLPLAAAGGTLAAVVAVYLLLLSSLRRPADGPSPGPHGPGGALPVQQAIAEGRRRLQAREFHLALEILQAAGGAGAADPDLVQLYRQADLLTHLSERPLEQIIQHGQTVGNPDEWREQFKQKYKGHGLLFDDVVRRDHEGHHHLTVYEVAVEGERARVELGLKLLDGLPLDEPRRLVFGARLARVEREAGNTWVVRFEPDSGVLLTDEGAAAACGLAPVDAELRAVLTEQAKWRGVNPRR